MMRKITTLALAAVMALGFAACSSDGGNGGAPQPTGTARLTIQLKGVKATASRATEAGADEDALDVTDAQSVIFVADATGQITQVVDLVKAQAVSPGVGQALPDPVALGSAVFVVANIPTTQVNSLKALTTLNDVKNASVAISTQAGFSAPAMANTSGEVAVVDSGNDGAETVSVRIAPLFARLELVALQAIPDAGGNTITDFDVTGVFVDDYFENFNLVGGTAGASEAKSISPLLDDAADDAAKEAIYNAWGMKDLGTWGADGDPLIAKLNNQVWGYNVVASGLPRFIVRLDNIVYTTSAGVAGQALTGPRYLTVTGYLNGESQEVTSFARGEVYRVGAIDDISGESNFQFSFAHLGLNPNEQSISLTVGVTVDTWSVNDYSPIL